VKAFAVLTIVSSALGACATPLPPTFTPTDVLTSNLTYSTTAALPATSIVSMPNASIGRFTGTLQGDVSATGTMIGNLAMDVNFASGQINGTASQVNIIDSAKPRFDQTLRGTLNVTGVVIANGMTAAATGKLSGSYYGFSGSANFNLGLAGTFRTQNIAADTITGTASGTATGDVSVLMTNGTFSVQR